MKPNPETARRYLDVRFLKMGNPEMFTRPAKGWIRAIRESLGMTAQQLAKRLGVGHTRVLAIEQDEVKGNLKLSTLERAAKALGCRFVYAFIPVESLQDTVRHRAAEKARQILVHAKHAMDLEAQATSENECNVQFERLVEDLLQGPPARLWDEP